MKIRGFSEREIIEILQMKVEQFKRYYSKKNKGARLKLKVILRALAAAGVRGNEAEDILFIIYHPQMKKLKEYEIKPILNFFRNITDEDIDNPNKWWILEQLNEMLEKELYLI